ncbi:hypothetical protein [Bathymodiolus platifrons methanotrophic gill symbiont]|uniref:hypothetical protein n=2 Tax=Bathymodiolus platifrons methanotrophic gill symbiont TaxID=113268 RepID=UPI000B411970|nr:hypothetical protein [Bathymodiolus platifrons methanotrophic gill symbiont]
MFRKNIYLNNDAQFLIEHANLLWVKLHLMIVDNRIVLFLRQNHAILPKMSPLNPQYLTKKQSVFQKIADFIEKFKGVGGKVLYRYCNVVTKSNSATHMIK